MGGFGQDFDWDSQQYYDPKSPRYHDPDLWAQIQGRKIVNSEKPYQDPSTIGPYEEPSLWDKARDFLSKDIPLSKVKEAAEFATLPITVPKQGLDLLTAHLTDEDKVLPTGEVEYPSIGKQSVDIVKKLAAKKSQFRGGPSVNLPVVNEFGSKAAEKAIDLVADPNVAMMGGLGKAGNAVLGTYFGSQAAESLGSEIGTGISEFEGGNYEKAAGHFGSATVDGALLGLITTHGAKQHSESLRKMGVPDANLKLKRPSTINVLDIEGQNPPLDFNVDPVIDQPLPIEAAGIRGITTENASGESAASAEAMSRQNSMKAKGEKFVVYDRAGNRRELIGPEAVDFSPQRGETYGIDGPDGFRTLTDNGGLVKANAPRISEPIPDQIDQIPDQPNTFEVIDEGGSLADALKEYETLPVDESPSMMETGKGQAGIGFDPRFIKIVTENLYQGDIGKIAAKESIQNAVDSIKALPGMKGKVNIDINTKDKTIRSEDNGIGMSPETAKNQFLDIGGSLKPGTNVSGGFGIGIKAALGNAEDVHIETRWKNPETGKVIQTIITGNTDLWISGRMPVEVIELPSDTPTGTIANFKLSKEIKPAESKGYLNSFMDNNRIPHEFNFKVDGEDIEGYNSTTKVNPEYLKYAKTPPAEREGKVAPPTVIKEKGQLNHISTLSLEGADVDVLSRGSSSSTNYLFYRVLNHGLPQFEGEMRLPEEVVMPNNLIIDVKSHGGPDEPNYPFTPDRERLKDTIKQNIHDFITEHMFNMSINKELKNYQETLESAPVISTSQTGSRFVDTSSNKRFAPLINDFKGDKRIGVLTDSYARAVQLMAGRLSKYNAEYGKTHFYGLGFGFENGKDYLGINIPVNRFMPDKQNVILINFPAIWQEIKADVKYGIISPGEAMREFNRLSAGTILHEVIHDKSRGHDVPFAGDLTRSIGRTLSELQVSAVNIDKFNKDFHDAPSFLDRITADYEKISTTGEREDIFGKIASNAEGRETEGSSTNRSVRPERRNGSSETLEVSPENIPSRAESRKGSGPYESLNKELESLYNDHVLGEADPEINQNIADTPESEFAKKKLKHPDYEEGNDPTGGKLPDVYLSDALPDGSLKSQKGAIEFGDKDKPLVKRHPGFSSYTGEGAGKYQVTYKGETNNIGRDNNTGWWYLNNESPLVKANPKYKEFSIGFTKKEAIDNIASLLDKRESAKPKELPDVYLSDLLPSGDPKSQRGAIGSDLGPLNRFENSQAKKYGPEWRSKQTSEEKAFHERLKSGQTNFSQVEPKSASNEPVGLVDSETLPIDEFTPMPDNVDRVVKRPDGSSIRYQTLNNDTIRMTHIGKDGNILSVKEGADFDSLKELDAVDASETEPLDPTITTGKIIPPDGSDGRKQPPSEGRKDRLTKHRVRLSNGEIVKIQALSPEDAVSRINDYIDKEYPESDVMAQEAERVMNPIERAIEGEPGFEKKMGETKSLSRDIEKAQLAEDEKGISQREREFRQRANLTQKIETAQAREEAKTRLKDLKEAARKLEEVPKTGRESIVAEDTFFQAWNKLHPIEKASETLGIVKNFASGGDLGHMMRQGKLMTVDMLFSKDASQVARALKTMGESAFSEKNFQAFHDKLSADPFIKLMTEKYGLDLPGVGKGLKEEIFHGNIAERIPVVGKGYVRPSERVYTSYLNALRASEVHRWKKILEKDGVTTENNPSAYRGLARAINIMGQRADISGSTQHVFNELSNVLWAPRSKFSRYQTIQELVGASSSDPVAKKLIRNSVAKVAAFNVGILGLLTATYGPKNVEFITDPDRTDFLKVRIGDATIDPWMGLGPIIRSMAKIKSGKSTSPHTGKTRKVNTLEIIGKEIGSGVAPGVAFLYEFAKGEDLAGYQKERSEAFENFLPLSGRQIYEILDAMGPEGIPLAAASYIGEGVDVFNYKKAKEKESKLKVKRGLKQPESPSKSKSNSRYAF